MITRLTQQVGGSFGTAILAVILQAGLVAEAARGASGVAAAYDQAFWWSIGFTALAVVLSLALPGRPRASAPAPSAAAPLVPERP